jgi:hypothetical protein
VLDCTVSLFITAWGFVLIDIPCSRSWCQVGVPAHRVTAVVPGSGQRLRAVCCQPAHLSVLGRRFTHGLLKEHMNAVPPTTPTLRPASAISCAVHRDPCLLCMFTWLDRNTCNSCLFAQCTPLSPRNTAEATHPVHHPVCLLNTHNTPDGNDAYMYKALKITCSLACSCDSWQKSTCRV